MIHYDTSCAELSVHKKLYANKALRIDKHRINQDKYGINEDTNSQW